KEEAIMLFEKLNINDLVLRSEALNRGLETLATEVQPEAFDQKKVSEFFSVIGSDRPNKSVSSVDGNLVLNDKVLEELYIKERLIFDRYYDGQISGIPDCT
ncbi:MAG: hypothetical protein AAFR39_06065, partial [Pseudomonadota bacterium]